MQQKYEVEELQSYDNHQAPNANQYVHANLDNSSNNSQVLDDIMIESSQNRKNRYGNIKILYQNSRFLFTIGPDYMCFTTAYIMFTLMSISVVYSVSTQIQNLYLSIITITYSVLQNLSYLAIAFSNPGIETSDTIPTDEDVNDEIKRMKKGTSHCRDCDVCIRNYDHHCPWTSKCIGEKNIFKFYVFVTLTMTYIVYCLILMLVCSAGTAFEVNSKLAAKTP